MEKQTDLRQENEPKPKFTKLKTFSVIYYVIIGILAIALFTLSCVNFVGTKQPTDFDTAAAVAHVQKMTERASASIYDETAHAERVKYITDKLDDFGLDAAESKTGGNDTYTTDMEGRITKPTFVSAAMTVKGSARADWEEKGEDGKQAAYADLNVTNIAAYFPSKSETKSNEVILVTAHYDSNVNSANAAALSGVAAMLETVKALKTADKTYTNDILFLFSDAGEENAAGLRVMSKFTGFNNAFSRVTFAINFDSIGASGTTVIYQNNPNNYNVMKKWSALPSSAEANSIINLMMKNDASDMSAISSAIPAVGLANFGGTKYKNTQLDKTPHELTVQNFGGLLSNAIEAFGSAELADLSSDRSAVFFSYLDAGAVVYSDTVAYVLGALIIVLALAAVIVGLIKNSVDTKSMFKGLLAQILTLAGCIVFAVASYYLIGAILAACGVFGIHALPTLTFSSMPLIIIAGLFTVAFSTILYHLMRKLFKINAGDMVRGNVMLWAVAAALISFIAPAASPLFAWIALMQCAVMLLSNLFKTLYKARTGESMDKLFLYVLPLVAMLPVFMSTLFILAEGLGAMWYFLITGLAVSFAGFISPYFSSLTPSLARLVAKFPAPSVRVVRTVTEPVEDEVKKGKFNIRTYRKTTRERVPLRYRTWHGATAVLCVALVTVFCLGAKGNYSSNLSGSSSSALTDDAMVYVIDKSSKAPADRYWMIGDNDAYHYLNDAGGAFKYDGGIGAYYSEDTVNTSKGDGFLPELRNSSETSNTRSFNVTPKLSKMKYSLTFKNVVRIKEIRIYSYLNNGKYSSVMRYNNFSGSMLQVNGLFGDCSVTIELKTDGKYTDSVAFDGALSEFAHDEIIGDKSSLLDFDGVWKSLNEYYATRAEQNQLRAGIVIKNYELKFSSND